MEEQNENKPQEVQAMEVSAGKVVFGPQGYELNTPAWAVWLYRVILYASSTASAVLGFVDLGQLGISKPMALHIVAWIGVINLILHQAKSATGVKPINTPDSNS
jgi:hypothetical protein